MENRLDFRDMIFVVMIRVAAVEKTRGFLCGEKLASDSAVGGTLPISKHGTIPIENEQNSQKRKVSNRSDRESI
jgi:hypothetical protein